jgi:hypothetical protein
MCGYIARGMVDHIKSNTISARLGLAVELQIECLDGVVSCGQGCAKEAGIGKYWCGGCVRAANVIECAIACQNARREL